MNELEYLKMFQAQPSMRPMVLCYFLERKYGIETLIKYAASTEAYPLPDYSSWVITHLVKEYPEDLHHFQPMIIDAFLESKNQTVLRNLLGAIILLPINEHKEGELFDNLINHLLNADDKVALHVNAIYKLMQFGEKFPELLEEIQAAITIRVEQNNQASLKAASKKFEKKFKRKLKA